MNSKLILVALVSLAACDIREVVHALSRVPTPVPRPTSTIGEPPVVTTPQVYNTCGKVPAVPDSEVHWGGGYGGVVWTKCKNFANCYAFITPSNIETRKSAKVCDSKKCIDLPWVACANPEHTSTGERERAHYKGPVALNKKDKWFVENYGAKGRLFIKNKERMD